MKTKVINYVIIIITTLATIAAECFLFSVVLDPTFYPDYNFLIMVVICMAVRAILLSVKRKKYNISISERWNFSRKRMIVFALFALPAAFTHVLSAVYIYNSPIDMYPTKIEAFHVIGSLILSSSSVIFAVLAIIAQKQSCIIASTFLMLVGFILYPAVPWYEIIALPIGFTFIIKYIINKYEN